MCYLPKQSYKINGYCRDKGAKSVYRAGGLVRGCLIVWGQINDSENVRIRAARASYD